MRRLLSVAGLLAGVLAALACTGYSASNAATATAQATSAAQSSATSSAASGGAPTARVVGGTTFNDVGTVNISGKGELSVSVQEFSFSPTFIQGQPGQKLTLQISNDANAKHNLSLTEENLDRDIDPRTKVSIEVTIPQSGALRFYCKYHAARGMNGELLAGTIPPQAVPSATGAAVPTASTGGSGDYSY